MLRKAVDEDIEQLVPLINEFAKKTPITSLSTIDIDKLFDICYTIISDEKGICYVYENQGKIEGFIIGHLGQLTFTREKSATTLCWWVKKDKRFFFNAHMLLLLFEEAAKQQGADNVIVVSVGPDYSKAIERFYDNRKYKPYEKIYIKDLR